MNESQTKYDLIEPKLRQAGWGEVEQSYVRKEFPITAGRLLGNGQKTKKLSADYVLEYKGRRIAVIEAKARDKYYTDGVAQAKDYADRLDIRYTYSTNGQRIYFIDMQEGKESDVDQFPTPDELWAMTFPEPKTVIEEDKADWKTRFNSIPFARYLGKYLPRYFQAIAIFRVLDAIAEGKERLLLTMATGTGKTATAFHICWKLFHARWNLRRDGSRLPRILFLADRNILADQAFNAFGEFDDDALVRIRPGSIKKRGHVPKNGSIFFTIFQSFMSGPDDSPYFGEYPPDFFDFIIIDECHRGGANDESSWRAIMDYFKPAVQLGLTATPKRDVNGDTYAYFGEPIYEYALKTGINDGFLTPFRVKEIQTTIDEYQYTSDDKVEEGDVEYERKYSEADFNKIIQIKEREEFRVKTFMDMINQKQKTLVFCATQLHAAAVRDLINQYADSKNPMYCCRVTADDGKLGEQHLRDFQDNEKNIPTILTTSQKLSTGVDAPEVRNIVLMRPVNSMVEFKQIVGRGTRLFDGKDYFTIYDFVKAHQHFSDPEWDGPPLKPEPRAEGTPRKCSKCGNRPCTCEKEPEPRCEVCNNDPCVCDDGPKRMLRITLADNKVRELKYMDKTSFWNPDGTPISAEEFLNQLFGDLPGFFKDEEELRRIWSMPGTRKKLLQELSEKGYSEMQLDELRKVVHGEDSDLYDVLLYVAYNKSIVPREQRANRAKVHLNSYSSLQQEFINFVLDQYVHTGVSELDDDKLPEIIELKYKAIADAKSKFGSIGSIRDTFIGFQKWLYEEVG